MDGNHAAAEGLPDAAIPVFVRPYCSCVLISCSADGTLHLLHFYPTIGLPFYQAAICKLLHSDGYTRRASVSRRLIAHHFHAGKSILSPDFRSTV